MTPDPLVGLNMRMAGAALDVTGRCLTRLPRRAKESAAVVLGWVLWRCEIHRPLPFPALFPDGAPAALRGRLRPHFMRRAMALFNLAEAVWSEPGRVLGQVSVTGWPDILALQRRGIPVILLGAHFMGQVIDFGNHHGRVAGKVGLDADAQIHKALFAHIGSFLSLTRNPQVDQRIFLDDRRDNGWQSEPLRPMR